MNYNKVGIIHNEGLEYVYEKIKKKVLEDAKSSQSTLKSTAINEDTYVNLQNLCNLSVSDFCKNKFGREIEIMNNLKREKSTANNNYNSLLNSVQLKYIERIKKIINYNYSKRELKLLKERLDLLNYEASKELNSSDLEVIYCATSTAYHSYQYWMKYYKKWYFAINFPEILKIYNEKELNNLRVKNKSLLRLKNTQGDEPNNSSNNSSNTNWWSDLFNNVEEWWTKASNEIKEWWEEDGKEIVNSDVEGAVDGALAGATAGASVGASAGGVGAAPGALSGAAVGAAAGGLGASAGTAVTQIWD